ncbi:hypothetical protein ACSMXN_05470 [Jatrophihabitans sp. DSM 45814]
MSQPGSLADFLEERAFDRDVSEEDRGRAIMAVVGYYLSRSPVAAQEMRSVAELFKAHPDYRPEFGRQSE